MTTIDIGLTSALVLIMILIAGAGVLQGLIATTLLAYFVYPRILFGEVDNGAFGGISGPNPVVYTWHLAIVAVIAYGVFRRDRVRFWIWPILPLVALSTIFFAVGWAHSRPLVAGYVHLLTVAASWVVGSVLSGAVQSTPNGERILSKWIAGIACFIAVVGILQIAGIDINSNSTKMLRSGAGARGTLEGSRVVATFNEPTGSGKALFLLAIIVVVWLFGRDVRKRWYSLLMLFSATVVLILTQTRTNMAAFGMLLLLYFLAVEKRNRFSRLLITVTSALLAYIATYSIWMGRSSEGAGIRGHTVKVAQDYLSSNPEIYWSGIGPNRYFEVFAPMDQWVVQGYPVHNVFLMLAVELGLAGAIFYMLPHTVLTVRAIKAVRMGSETSKLAKAWLCALPGLLLMGTFGWGLLGVIAPAIFLVMGYVNASLDQPAAVGREAVGGAEGGVPYRDSDRRGRNPRAVRR